MKNFLILLILVGGLSGWYFYQQTQTTKQSLVQEMKNLADYEGFIDTRRTEYETIVGALEMKKKVETRRSDLTTILNKKDELISKLNDLTQQKREIIARIRESAINVVLPELKLSDGRILTQVRLSKIDDSGISISLPSGVQRVSPHELPADLRVRLHFP